MSFPAHQRCLLELHKQTTLMPQFCSHVCEFLMTLRQNCLSEQ